MLDSKKLQHRFKYPIKPSTVVEPCTECEINEDCGDWDLNHMKCEKSKCICGQNWLIGKNRRCNKLNRSGIKVKRFVIASVLAQVVDKIDGIIFGAISSNYAYSVKREMVMYLKNSQLISAKTS